MTLKYKVGQTVVIGYLDPEYEWDELYTGMEVVINLTEVDPFDDSIEFYHVTPVGKETYPLGQLLVGDDEIAGLSTLA